MHILLALVKRLVLVLPVIWAVVTLVFLLIHIVPGDPVRNALGENATEAQVAEYLGNIHGVIEKCAGAMPSHADFIANNCAAHRSMAVSSVQRI